MARNIDFKKQNIPFTQVANGVLNDSKLTPGAKGLYAYLYSKPDGWQFSAVRISKDFKCGRDHIITLLKELDENGYLSRHKMPDGRMAYEVIFPPLDPKPDIPVQAPDPKPEKAKVGNSLSGKFRSISNKELISNKEEESNKESRHSLQTNELIKAFEGINPACSKMYGNKTQRNACLALIENYSFERVLDVINKTLPKTNKIDFLPIITTPLQLSDKWAALEAGISKFKNKDKNNVAFT